MTQRIKRRERVGGKRRPLKQWEVNRLQRNSREACTCAAMPFPHRAGSRSVVRIGRASIEVKCGP